MPSLKPVGMLLLFLYLIGLQVSLQVEPALSRLHVKDFVYVYINEPPYGNWTYIPQPVSPIRINESQIKVGANWTYVFSLAENRTYHAYCFGDWLDDGTEPLTDYDIYVYDPSGNLVGSHTESAGLPEHLGVTLDEPYFEATESGNYTFVIRNDPRESQAAEQATLMVIEHIEPNTWHSSRIDGKQNATATEFTSWAYEFTSSSERVEIQVEVPDSLDMYEARLYLMGCPSAGKGETLNGVPLAWEPGLFGEASGFFGGFNLYSEGFRGNAFASCEHSGEAMFINYTSSYKEKALYHLVLIGEQGSGNVSFRIKTNFGNSELKLTVPLQRIYPGNETVMAVGSNNSYIQSALLRYSTDGWNTSIVMNMQVNNRTCNGTIPGQEAGVTVHYRVEAADILDNIMSLNGNFTVKHPSRVNFTLSTRTLSLGDNVSLSGFVAPVLGFNSTGIKLVFMSPNGSTVEKHYDLQLGSNFSASFQPLSIGTWSVETQFDGDSMRFKSPSVSLTFMVTEQPFMKKYSIFLYGGIGVSVAAVVILYVIRRRR